MVSSAATQAPIQRLFRRHLTGDGLPDERIDAPTQRGMERESAARRGRAGRLPSAWCSSRRSWHPFPDNQRIVKGRIHHDAGTGRRPLGLHRFLADELAATATWLPCSWTNAECQRRRRHSNRCSLSPASASSITPSASRRQGHADIADNRGAIRIGGDPGGVLTVDPALGCAAGRKVTQRPHPMCCLWPPAVHTPACSTQKPTLPWPCRCSSRRRSRHRPSRCPD